MKKMLFIASSALLSVAAFGVTCYSSVPQNSWTAATAPVEAKITGGPWTLGQGPTTPTLPSVDYCVNGVPQPNNGTNLMQPYYYPFVTGSGKNLQGYFDYRAKDTNEAVVAAKSKDGGLTWTFQNEVLELNPGLCPSSDSKTNAQTYPATTTPNPYPNPPASNVLLSTATGSPGATDDGQGHSTVLKIGGVSRLYTIDRSVNPDGVDNLGSVDNLGLVVHTLRSKSLDGVEATSPDTVPNKGTRTTGLLNPDGILAEVPGSYPRAVLYVQKQLKADTTLLPPNQLCSSPTIGYQKGKAPNTDYVTVRLATTTDGVNFTDRGPVKGLNDQADTSLTGTRYIASRGTLIRLPDNRYGLFFSGGNCLDADSDAFHYIGYAESRDLRHWKVINGLDNPIASVQNTNVTDPGTNIPANPPLIPTQVWFQQRVYTPNAIINNDKQVSLIFAGYSVKGPSSDYSNYRTITQVTLNSALPISGFESADFEQSDDFSNHHH
jgi:hypothetical protein